MLSLSSNRLNPCRAAALAAVLAISLFGVPAQAQRIYVNAAVATSGDGSSWAKAYKSLGSGVSAAPTGSEIWVAEGVYNSSITIYGNLVIRGGFRGDETLPEERDGGRLTIISGLGSRPITVSGSRIVTLDGLVLTGGLQYTGGAFNASGTTSTLVNCIITGNGAGTGSGLYISGGHLSVDRCLFVGNKYYSANDTPATIQLRDCTAVIQNSLVAGNVGSGIDAIYGYNKIVRVDHCTIADNNRIGISVGELRASNSIVARNGTHGLLHPGWAALLLEHCLIDGNVLGDVHNYSAKTTTIGAEAINRELAGSVMTIGGAPRFAMDEPGNVSGEWSSGSIYNSSTRRTTFTASGAGFVPGALVGRLLIPDRSKPFVMFVVENTTSQLTVLDALPTTAADGREFLVADYHLAEGSPAIDRATAGGPALDIDGDARPGTDGVADIGIDETLSARTMTPDVTPPISVMAPLDRLQAGTVFTIRGGTGDALSGAVSTDVYYRHDGGAWTLIGTQPTSFTLTFDSAARGGAGRYDFKARAIDVAGNREPATKPADASTLVLGSFAGTRLYVRASQMGAERGESWGTALRSEAAAVEV